ncbi:hypothetical protein ZWY2020_043859 [Hordeum vulgare]|nr:hypothetical protein ZWY2020_043859 [Hordeum vulgare]
MAATAGAAAEIVREIAAVGAADLAAATEPLQADCLRLARKVSLLTHPVAEVRLSGVGHHDGAIMLLRVPGSSGASSVPATHDQDTTSSLLSFDGYICAAGHCPVSPVASRVDHDQGPQAKYNKGLQLKDPHHV